MITAALASLCGGCFGISETTGLPTLFDVPRPYEGRHRNLLAVRGIAQSASITVFPVADLPPGWGMTLARHLEQAAQVRDVPLQLKDGADTADQLMGRASLVDSEDGTWIHVHWQHLDAGGTFLTDFVVSEKLKPIERDSDTELASPWDYLQTEHIKALAEQTADRIQARLELAQGRDPAKEIVRNRIVLRPVSGAPGDGGRTLTVSLARFLGEADYQVDTRWQMEDAPIPFGAVMVLGEVDVTTLETGVDKVDLTWTVLDHRARRMGQIQQTNTVPQGRLDETWGDVAVFAALGARDGILDLLAHMSMRES